jgi:HK97 gp10 family phage protein
VPLAEIDWDDGVIEAMFRPGGQVHNEVQRRAVKVERAAKRLCPVDTGRLRSSITHSEPERRGDVLVVRIGTNVEYARFVELGTSRMSAQPYLRPALDAAR